MKESGNEGISRRGVLGAIAGGAAFAAGAESAEAANSVDFETPEIQRVVDTFADRFGMLFTQIDASVPFDHIPSDIYHTVPQYLEDFAVACVPQQRRSAILDSIALNKAADTVAMRPRLDLRAYKILKLLLQRSLGDAFGASKVDKGTIFDPYKILRNKRIGGEA